MARFGLDICACFVLAMLLPCSAAAQQQTITFAQDIAPILNANCVPCHHQGGAGPFPLVSYQDARKHARQLAEVTRSRYMPPWLPEHGYGEFAGELRLTESQIQTVARWVQQGELAGDLTQAPKAAAEESGWTLGTPDLIVQASQPFSAPPGGQDVFWNFTFLPHVKQSHYVRAVEIRPSNPRLIHHANIIIDHTGSVTEPFAGMDVVVPRNPLDYDGHFLFYKPGAPVAAEPTGFSWRLDPFTTLILNTHIQPSGKRDLEQPSIALYFTDQPPQRFAYLLELQDDDALDIPAGVRNFRAADDFRLPIDTQVIAIYPHAHYLGKRLEAWAALPDGSVKPLIRIIDWDSNWQAVYRYRDPVFLPAGTVISMRYVYDNSSTNPRNPSHPPRRVTGGNQAKDEMAHLWLQLLPANRWESRALYAEAWARHELARNPANYAAELTLGSLALAHYQAAEAVTALQKARELQPRNAIARNLYGAALSSVGRNAEAMHEFQEALKLKPNFANARFHLAQALTKAGRNEEATQNLNEILVAYPNDAAAQQLLAQIRMLISNK